MENKLNYNKKEKILIGVTITSLLMIFIGMGYAYFTANNPQGSTAEIISQSGRMLLTYDDGIDNILPITDIQPSNNIIVDKTFSLTGINTTANNGQTMPFSISLEYQNTFQNWELEYFLKRMDTNENVSVEIIDMYGIGPLNEEIINSTSIFNETFLGYFIGAIEDWNGDVHTQEIASGYFSPSSNEQTIIFNLKMMFPDIGRNQDHNKGATFNGKIVVNGSEASSFATDSWETIANNINAGNASIYRIGSEKEVEIDGNNYTVRVANNSTPSECSTADFSQTACGFVIEFVDIVEQRAMNSTNTNAGGWRDSAMRTYLNGDFYNNLPIDLKSVITDTQVISGHGNRSTETNFATTDKIYLLSAHEVWTDGTSNIVSTRDTAYNNTRQLDYYQSKGVTTSSYLGAIKKYSGSNSSWWLRAAFSNSTNSFLGVYNDGDWINRYAHDSNGVSPAFRIG